MPGKAGSNAVPGFMRLFQTRPVGVAIAFVIADMVALVLLIAFPIIAIGLLG